MDKDFMGVYQILKDEEGWEPEVVDGMTELTFLPSMQDFTRLRKWICWGDGLDPDGRWLGFCPIHDRRRAHEGSATYDFVKSMFRCNGDPSCHGGKRAISIYNLFLELAYQRLA